MADAVNLSRNSVRQLLDFLTEVDRDVTKTADLCQILKDAVFSHASYQFRCSHSSASIMSDPMILASGQNVDWQANRNMFRTSEVIRNHALLHDIKQWLSSTLVELLLNLMSFSEEHQNEAALVLRAMINFCPSCAATFHELGVVAVLRLVKPLLTWKLSAIDPLREHILAIAMLLSQYHTENRRLFSRIPAIVDIIAESLKVGTGETKLLAMTLIYHFSAVPDCRGVLQDSDIIVEIFILLRKRSPLLIAAFAELCVEEEFRLLQLYTLLRNKVVQ